MDNFSWFLMVCWGVPKFFFLGFCGVSFMFSLVTVRLRILFIQGLAWESNEAWRTMRLGNSNSVLTLGKA